MPHEHELEAAERAAIIAEWERLRAEPRPPAPPPYGCATFLVAAALLLIVPQLLKLAGWELPRPLELVALVVLALAMAGGLFVSIFVGSGIFGRASNRANAAIDWLEANPGLGDPEERRRQAVTLLFNAVVSDGPTTSGTLDSDRARERLGANLPYVLAVERALVEERGLWVVFGEKSK